MPPLFWTTYDILKPSSLPAWLSPIERLQLQAFSSERRRRNWLAGRLAAKTLLSHYLREQENRSIQLADIEIDYSAQGEPQARVNGQTLAHLSLSIAHSHGHGFAGLALLNEEGRIGVDIEFIRAINPRLSSRILTPQELRALHRSSNNGEHERLILYWTLKEAALKALKPVLAVSMAQLEVQMGKSWEQAQIHTPLSDVSLEARYQQEHGVIRAYALVPPALLDLIAERRPSSLGFERGSHPKRAP